MNSSRPNWPVDRRSMYRTGTTVRTPTGTNIKAPRAKVGDQPSIIYWCLIIIDYFEHRYSIDIGFLHIDGSMMGGQDISMDHDCRSRRIDGSIMGDRDISMDQWWAVGTYRWIMMGGMDISMDHDGQFGHIDGSWWVVWTYRWINDGWFGHIDGSNDCTYGKGFDSPCVYIRDAFFRFPH